MSEFDPIPLPVEATAEELLVEPLAYVVDLEAQSLPRIPHLGHALLFAVVVFVLLLGSQAGALVLVGLRLRIHDTARLIPHLLHPKIQLATMAVTYIASLLLGLAVFPRLWHRGFAQGIHWNAASARLWGWRIVPAGMILSWSVQALQTVLPTPKSAPIDSFFTSASDVWLVALFGTLLAPLTEEIFFRGLLLPACAIAFDWVMLKRDSGVYLAWRTSDTFSPASLIFSTLFTSGLFALLHAAQLGYSWSSVAVLLGVSLVLTFVRVKTNSVACSTLMHATYNFTVFLTLFVGTGGFRHLEKMAK
jgi:membrane protease YdiL (CAAX protease family)